MARLTARYNNQLLIGTLGSDEFDATGYTATTEGPDTVIQYWNSRLIGRAGNDTYHIDWGDTVEEAAGGGIDTVHFHFRPAGNPVPEIGSIFDVFLFQLPDNVENLVYDPGNFGEELGIDVPYKWQVEIQGNSLDNSLTSIAGAVVTIRDGSIDIDLGSSDIFLGGSGNDFLQLSTITKRDSSAYAFSGLDVLVGDSAISTGENLGDDVLIGDSLETDALLVTSGFARDLLIGDDFYAVSTAGADYKSGNDTIRGGNGRDSISGDAIAIIEPGITRFVGGDDYLYGDQESSSVGGDDQFYGDVAGDLVSGVGGDDQITGGGGNDRAAGDAGEDLGGEGGDDWIDGGEGADTLFGDAEGALFGKGGSDTLWGGHGNDVLFGDSGGILGVSSQAGTDVLSGGMGDDVLFGDGSGEELLVGRVWTPVNPTGGADSLAGDEGNDSLAGGRGDDVLLGGADDDWLTGDAGNDAMIGGTGNDTYFMVEADDLPIVEEADGGDDTVITDAAVFTLAPEIETLIYVGDGPFTGFGNEGINHISGGDSNDSLFGNGGADVLVGGLGADYMAGGAGDDAFEVDSAGDVVQEEASGGTDTVYSSLSNYFLADHVENLRLTGTPVGPFGALQGHGNALDNLIVGTDSETFDWLYGEAGNDTLDGRGGLDYLIGGTGDDTYHIETSRVAGVVGEYVVEHLNEGSDTVILGGSNFDYYVLLPNFENLVASSGIEARRLIGNSDINLIVGNEGNNSLDGWSGTDTLRGGDGDDIYVVREAGSTAGSTDIVEELMDEGRDRVLLQIQASGLPNGYELATNVEDLEIVGRGAINAVGNALDNFLQGNSSANRLEGGAGHDTLHGGRGNDSLIGDAGADTLDGGRGADILQGGAGDDTYRVDSNLDIVRDFGGAHDTIISTIGFNLGTDGPDDGVEADGLGIEHLVLEGAARVGSGNSLDNRITGNNVSNRLSGLAGADTLDGGAGADILNGGAGNDTYLVDETSDRVVELAAGGTDTVISQAAEFTLANFVENLQLEGDAFRGIGNSLGNTLSGSDADNELFGMDGNDSVVGGNGTNLLIGGLGRDFVSGGENADYIAGDDYEGSISGVFSTPYTLTGIGGDDELWGGAGDDQISGDSYALGGDAVGGDDVIHGGAGEDLLAGEAFYFVEGAQAGDDVIHGDAGNDWIWGDTVAADIPAEAGGRDTLFGGDGNDLIWGDAGADSLFGDAGNDWLDGGLGADSMAGGAGDDIFFVDDIDDVVIDTSGLDLVDATVSYTLPTGIENLKFRQGTSGLRGVGNDGENTLTDFGSGSTLEGLAGNDTYVFDVLDVLDRAIDSAGDDSVRAVIAEPSGAGFYAPFFSGIEHVVLEIASRPDSNNAIVSFSNVTGVRRIDVEGSKGGVSIFHPFLGPAPVIPDALALINLPTLEEGLGIRNYTGELVLPSLLPGNGIDIQHVDLTLHQQNISRLRLNVSAVQDMDVFFLENFVALESSTDPSVTPFWGENAVLELVGNGAPANVVVTGETSADLQILLRHFDGIFGAPVRPGGEMVVLLDDATAILSQLSPLPSTLHLETRGAGESNFNVLGQPINQIIVGHNTDGSDGRLTLTGVGSHLDARTFEGELSMAVVGSAAVTIKANTEVTRVIVENGTALSPPAPAAAAQRFEFSTYLDARDVVLDLNAGDGDLLTADISGLGVGFPEVLDLTGVETLEFTATSAAAVSLARSSGINTVRLGNSAGVDAAISLFDVNAEVVADAAYDGRLTVDLADGMSIGRASGGTAGDILNGGDNLSGGDTLTGLGGADTLSGNGGGDTLVGGLGNDLLNGGDGIDRLDGGVGADIFVFDAELASSNVDAIVRFEASNVNEKIRLDQSVFDKVALGSLRANQFLANYDPVAQNQGALERILFDPVARALYYDADGNGAEAAVQFATIGTLVGTLTNTSFTVVA